MKRRRVFLWLSPAATLLLAAPLTWAQAGQENAATTVRGTLVQNGIAMPVEGACAAWDDEDPFDEGEVSLEISLFPFSPTPEEIEVCTKGYSTSPLRPSIDPDLWPRMNPKGQFVVVWRTKSEGVGKLAEARFISLSFNWIDPDEEGQGGNLGLTFSPSDIEATLEGDVRPGSEIHLKSKGEDTLGGAELSWDLDIRTTLLQRKRR